VNARFQAGPCGGPETLFRVSPIEMRSEDVRQSMRTGQWLLGQHGRPSAGALGVLADNLLGNALASRRPAGHWLVTTEISLDICKRLPADGSLLLGHSRPVMVQGLGGLASGEIADAVGDVVAIGTFRGRYTPGVPDLAEGRYGRADLGPHDIPVPERPSLESLLAMSVDRVDSGVLATLPVDPMFANPVGNLHGGMLLCASEIAGSHALRTVGDGLATTSIRIAYLRPGPMTGAVTLTADVTHRGRTFGHANVVARGENGKPFGTATVVCQAEG
jgi:uncharacterized protein (TIGR00369 family)